MKSIIAVLLLFCVSSMSQAANVLCFHTDKGTLYLFTDNSALFFPDNKAKTVEGSWMAYGDEKLIIAMESGEKRLVSFAFADICIVPDFQ